MDAKEEEEIQKQKQYEEMMKARKEAYESVFGVPEDDDEDFIGDFIPDDDFDGDAI